MFFSLTYVTIAIMIDDPLVTEVDRRRRRGQSDEAFAQQYLGVSGPMWSMVKQGKRRMGMKMLRSIKASWPKSRRIKALVEQYMMGQHRNSE